MSNVHEQQQVWNVPSSESIYLHKRASAEGVSSDMLVEKKRVKEKNKKREREIQTKEHTHKS